MALSDRSHEHEVVAAAEETVAAASWLQWGKWIIDRAHADGTIEPAHRTGVYPTPESEEVDPAITRGIDHPSGWRVERVDIFDTNTEELDRISYFFKRDGREGIIIITDRDQAHLLDYTTWRTVDGDIQPAPDLLAETA